MSTHIARKVTTGLITLAMAGVGSAALATTASAAPVDTVAIATKGSAVTRWIKSPDGFANVRSGPSVDCPVIRKLPQCAMVRVVETKGGWSRLADGGWVANWLLSTKNVCKLPDTGCPSKCPSKPKPDPCRPHKCPAKPQCLFRVVVEPWKNTESAARKLAERIGGGAFIRQRNGQWLVQVGAFANPSNAAAREAAFSKLGAYTLPCF